MGKNFVKQNWDLGFDENGRPMKDPALWPKPMGGTHRRAGQRRAAPTGIRRRTARTPGCSMSPPGKTRAALSGKGDPGPWAEGQRYTGNGPRCRRQDRTRPGPRLQPVARRTGPGRAIAAIKTEAEGYGAIRALDPQTGEKKWDFKMVDYTESGVLSTAGDLVFGGGMDGDFVALDARTGELLWHANLGGPNASGPISYAVNGKQYVIGTGEGTMYAFALPDR